MYGWGTNECTDECTNVSYNAIDVCLRMIKGDNKEGEKGKVVKSWHNVTALI